MRRKRIRTPSVNYRNVSEVIPCLEFSPFQCSYPQTNMSTLLENIIAATARISNSQKLQPTIDTHQERTLSGQVHPRTHHSPFLESHQSECSPDSAMASASDDGDQALCHLPIASAPPKIGSPIPNDSNDECANNNEYNPRSNSMKMMLSRHRSIKEDGRMRMRNPPYLVRRGGGLKVREFGKIFK